MKSSERSQKADMEITKHEVLIVKKASGSGYYRLAKRCLDLIMAVPGSILILPVLGMIALAIKLDSKGPVIFKQERLGLNGKPFIFYKFRSMVDQADASIHKEYIKNLINGEADSGRTDVNGNHIYKLDEDDRVTRVGHFLRRTSLDELPQLFNVIKGEMSLVGPRPPIAYEVEMYEPRHMRRLMVIPGMTGLWQVSGRSELDFEDMVNLDILYIDQQSLGLDLKILLKTLAPVLSRKGAW